MLAEAGLLGLPVERMYRSQDRDEQELLKAALVEARDVFEDLATIIACKIVKEQAEAQKRGRNKKK